ncbi:MAG TPA: aspartate 1-decarboxylase, partial [bacterium]|jgi:aspartate 1-decarboxylase|nr:aspartate 1-decarboxylase [bacterium]
VGMNGAAALLCSPGDVILVVAFAQLETAEIGDFEALTVMVDARNRVKKTVRAKASFAGRPAPKK